MDSISEYRSEYERICQELPIGNDKLDYSRCPTRSSGNHPADYNTLTDEEKEVLHYWIQHAIIATARWNTNSSSYGLKHQFEREGFYITNGQFKGAMICAGHLPKDIYELNWCFQIRPRWKCESVSREYRPRETYSLACFDKQFARLLLKAHPDQREWG